MKEFKLDQKTVDMLDELEYIKGVVDKDIKEGNFYGSEIMMDENINAVLRGLGINRRIARDLGWDL